MKIKTSGAKANQRYVFKAITLLVEKGHSVLAIGQNGEVVEKNSN
jgi:hypothetical protein